MPFPVLAAMGLVAEFAPGIVRWLAGDKAGDVADKVASVAGTVTGTSDAEQAAAVMRADPALAVQFRQAMAAYELDLERLYLADRQDARARDLAMRQSGQRNIRADLMVLGAAAILISCLASLVFLGAALGGEAVGIISTVAGIAGKCLSDAFQFEFGSSRGSKNKDAILTGRGG